MPLSVNSGQYGQFRGTITIKAENSKILNERPLDEQSTQFSTFGGIFIHIRYF